MPSDGWIDRFLSREFMLRMNLVPRSSSNAESQTISSTLSLRSNEATHSVYVQFQNGTERFVDIIWIDYTGQWIRYETLSPGSLYEVYTYVSHPWVFLDGESGIRLHAAGRGKVFYPLMSDVRQDVDSEGLFHLLPVKIIVSVPVFSLKERCLEVVCQLTVDKNCLDQLNLPRELMAEIQIGYDAPSSYAVLDSATVDAVGVEAEEMEGDEGFNENSADVEAENEEDEVDGDEEDDGDAVSGEYFVNENVREMFDELAMVDMMSTVLQQLTLNFSQPSTATTSSVSTSSTAPSTAPTTGRPTVSTVTVAPRGQIIKIPADVLSTDEDPAEDEADDEEDDTDSSVDGPIR